MFTPYIDIQDEILERLDELDIYQYYLNKSIRRVPFKCNSPFREEQHPSFGLFYNNSRILWRDFTLQETGNVFSFIMKMYGINYYEALHKIKTEMIENKITSNIETKRYNVIKENTESSIDLLFYYFKDNEIPNSYWKYWNNYKVITKEILQKNHVKCPKYVYLNNKLIATYKDDDILIRYIWKRKGIEKHYYKLYRPMNKADKWISNFRGASKWLIHGLNTINKEVDYIIITKSVKDKMVLEGLGFNAINIQNEGITIPREIIEYLKKFYTRFFLLYDNDYNKPKNWGQLAAKKLIKEYSFIKNIKIDGRYQSSDISEYIFKYDEFQSKQLIERLLSEK